MQRHHSSDSWKNWSEIFLRKTAQIKCFYFQILCYIFISRIVYKHLVGFLSSLFWWRLYLFYMVFQVISKEIILAQDNILLLQAETTGFLS